MRKASRFIAIALLVVTGVSGLYNTRGGLNSAATTLQQTVAFAVGLYGMLGLVGAVGLVRRRPWSTTVAIVWSVAVTYAATIASFAFHDPGLRERASMIGMAATFISCALLGWFVVWTARAATSVVRVASADPK